MKDLRISALKVQTPPGHDAGPVIKGTTVPPKIAEGLKHLAEDPYALAAQGPLVVGADLQSNYDRPGLASMSTLGVRVAQLTGGSIKPKNHRAIIASVADHPHLDGPISDTIKTSIAELFPERVTEQSLTFTTAALRMFPVQRADARGRTNLLDRIHASPMTRGQKERVLECLAEFRTSLDEHRDFDRGASEVNWKHICGEISQVLDACESKALSPEKTEDAVLSSLFSDCVKFGSTLMNHNIDGAIAAYHVLSRRNDRDMPPQRLAGIIAATKEHQIGPPGLFAKLAADVFIPLTFSPPFNPDQMAATAVARDEIRTKIADPMNSDHVVVGEGGAAYIDFSVGAQTLLATIGINEWPVPHPDNDWFDASMAVITGDSLINYASPEGVGKIVMLSGPGNEPFTDPTVFHSMFSCGVSYLDAKQVVSEDFAALYRAGAEYTQGVLQHARDYLNAQLATGYLPFPAEDFDSMMAMDSVELSKLTVERHGDQVFVHVPGDRTDVPFVHKPLDYETEDASFEFAKVVRRTVGDLCRDHMEWMPEQEGAAS